MHLDSLRISLIGVSSDMLKLEFETKTFNLGKETAEEKKRGKKKNTHTKKVGVITGSACADGSGPVKMEYRNIQSE